VVAENIYHIKHTQKPPVITSGGFWYFTPVAGAIFYLPILILFKSFPPCFIAVYVKLSSFNLAKSTISLLLFASYKPFNV
jgi:hypothetical protein